MRILHQLVALWRSLFRSSRVDGDLGDEMRYIERQTDASIARGMTPEAARRAARLTFGSVDAAHETARDERPGAGIRQVLQDVRFGVRLLRKSAAFGITAVVIVALGIGAATAIFSVVHGVMLEPLAFREPERLVSIWLTRRDAREITPAAADAIALRELRVFEDVAFFEDANLNLVGGCPEGGCEPQRLQGASVSPNLFSVLGVSPALGRTFAQGEDQPGAERVVLLSDALWHGRFGADRSAVGRQIRLNGSLHTVIGIMPPDFQYPTSAHQAWVPLVLEPGELTREATDNYRVVARLSPGATLEQARREAALLAERLAQYEIGNEAPGMTVDSMLDDAVREVRPPLLLLLGAVVFLLLVACMNLANLFGARARARSSEFAVRLALGASRKRLIAQSISEALPVLVLGGVLGVALAEWAISVFVVIAPAGLPRVETIALSTPVLAFSLALLILTGCAASIAQDRMVLAARSELEATALIAPAIRAIRSVDPDQSVYNVRTMTEIVDRSLAQRRLTTLLMAGFSGLALLLVAVGIYGVVAYGVTQRMREFGIRVALGGTRRDVTRLVVWQGTSMAFAGSAVGLAFAIAAARLMSNLVYGVAPTDGASMFGATAVLMLVAGVASYIPARRAAAVDPTVTLRAE